MSLSEEQWRKSALQLCYDGVETIQQEAIADGVHVDNSMVRLLTPWGAKTFHAIIGCPAI